ncbi:MAG: monofunctional biosynthetic peptidoglycan transglycosylase [Deltaproteobacteria bacterium CG12_big_fil_rev_8_21_14_0_65_43_10]|nr:MAG: monofunctional biosynthetic peptidoglycan transglycosylase [Deltaproteobacteria bacterium CG12_big_fil_rev_8_21_14_0_65_43_10]PIU86376.1 MAG: monofunctional biosynthetic peptidoglycan transglycosylase [Deltaproteobacteria bacterium CG06_land_8_20_14_3_00_44_19]PIX26132.1 MAG: monofunctional biosynthetic peptidoglycan transglycosylase [Deltaproteobacteria bacterium CG_4_8_14_3_um_filter_43_13]PJB39020.1 MAG: monofunctional biosynthetic peptidoglycan transglycosylase [Deltaproteobacteria b
MIKKWFVIVAILLVSALFLNICFYFIYPDVSMLKKKHPEKTAIMEYREREWQRQGINKKIKYKWVPLSKISPYVIKAVIIAEDDKFWSHEGFDFEAIEKAIEKDIKKKRFKAGGSTISQQLAKNLYLSLSKNPVRKLKEAVLTWRIERSLSKRKIIELYLNIAEWGDGLFGIEVAAQHYFGKHASSLTAEEAANLAAVLPNPRRYSPTGKTRYVVNRPARIYRIMIRRGIVIPEYEEVMKEPDDVPVENLEMPDEQQEPDDQESADVISNGIDESGGNDGRSDSPQPNAN